MMPLISRIQRCFWSFLVLAVFPPAPPIPTEASELLDPSLALTVWYTGHSGFAVKVGSKLLIFDYTAEYGTPSETPDAGGLGDGIIQAEDLAGSEVFVFVSHSHGDHFDPAVLAWSEEVEGITYFFGWDADEGEGHHYLAGPRATAQVAGMEIYTINSHHSSVPEVAFLVHVDGLWIYHNGDYQMDYIPDFEYLATLTDHLDLVFHPGARDLDHQYGLQAQYLLNNFNPGAFFPMHYGDEEVRGEEFARAMKNRGFQNRILVPLRRGDRWDLAPTADSSLLFTIPEHDLYPENIAFDAVTGDFFLGSMGQSRILRIRADGSYEDFVSGLEPQLQSAVGMKVDPQRRRLWVCTGRFTLFGGAADGVAETGVLLFDLENGDLIRSWLVEQPSPYHIFNDLALAADGSVYATTTLFDRVYRITAEAEEMELVLETEGRHNNGITLGPEERYLFLTLDRNVSRLELETGELRDLEAPGEATLGSDGLYFVDGSLVVVKPRYGEVARLFLNEALDRVERVESLAQGDPAFAYPTTGVVVENRLVFVATSFADVPRTPGAASQHPDVLIHQVPLGEPSGS